MEQARAGQGFGSQAIQGRRVELFKSPQQYLLKSVDMEVSPAPDASFLQAYEPLTVTIFSPFHNEGSHSLTHSLTRLSHSTVQ